MPVVMTCDEPVRQRCEGCWGGLVTLGNAPTTRGTDVAEGTDPQTRPLYGGNDPPDSSGVLRCLKVEFAAPGARSAGLGPYSVGSGTRINHVQTHASAGEGIRFLGGTASCMYRVSSGAMGDGLAWTQGRRGTAQHVYVQEGQAGGGHGVEDNNDGLGFDWQPRSSRRPCNSP